jgi:hypothetical protein
MRLPFLRRTVPAEEYAALAGEALAQVLPVAALLRARGVAAGSEAEQGRAHTVELLAVREHLDRLAPVERAVRRVRPPHGLAGAERSLRVLLEAYRGALREYAGACEAVRDADVEAYRAHNRRGAALDARACEAALALAGTGLELPEGLRRIADRAEAYRNVQGGAFAFWE